MIEEKQMNWLLPACNQTKESTELVQVQNESLVSERKSEMQKVKASGQVRVPKEFFKIDVQKSVEMTATRLLFFAGIIGMLGLVATSSMSLWIVVPLALVLGFLGGVALQNLALIGHDGSHFSLHKNRFVSMVWGIVSSAWVPLHFDVGFGLGHALHHRFTNREKDPDRKVFGQFKTVWGRLFLARSAASKNYFRETLSLALGKWPESKAMPLNLSVRQMVVLARINLAASGAVLVFYGALIAVYPMFFGVSLGLSYLFAILLSGIRPYLEHAGTGLERSNNSRTWSSPIINLFFGQVNFHHAHHLYPAVPSYRLQALDTWLIENGQIGRGAVRATRLSELVHAIRYQNYGETCPFPSESKSQKKLAELYFPR